MRNKVLGISLAILFFGSIASSTFAMASPKVDNIIVVDDDKNKSKSKKTSKKECDAKKECCETAKAKSCDDKKSGDKR